MPKQTRWPLADRGFILDLGRFFLSFICLWMESLYAEPSSQVYDLPQVVAVQNRTYQIHKDLTLQAGWLPSDAFNKGYTLGGSYTHFFKSYLGWEIINAHYSFHESTHLKKDLMDCCSLEVKNVGFHGALDYIQWYALTSVVYTPLYIKYLLFNKYVMNGDLSFVGGVGSVYFAETGARALVSAGFYFRFFTQKTRSWKFDFRNNLYFEKSLGVVNAISLMVGYSFELESPLKNSLPKASNDL